MSRNSLKISLFLSSLLAFTGPAFSKDQTNDQGKADRKIPPSVSSMNKKDSDQKESGIAQDPEEVATSKTIETPVGPATISVEEKDQPEPALKPHLLQVMIKCQGGKKFRQSVSVCDSDLAHTLEGDLLKVSYFYADPEALGTEQEEDGPECDEENPFELQIKLSEACGKSRSSKSGEAGKKSAPKKK